MSPFHAGWSVACKLHNGHASRGGHNGIFDYSTSTHLAHVSYWYLSIVDYRFIHKEYFVRGWKVGLQHRSTQPPAPFLASLQLNSSYLLYLESLKQKRGRIFVSIQSNLIPLHRSSIKKHPYPFTLHLYRTSPISKDATGEHREGTLLWFHRAVTTDLEAKSFYSVEKYCQVTRTMMQFECNLNLGWVIS